MLVVRPAGPADLDFLLELAILSGPGFTSLPWEGMSWARRAQPGQRPGAAPKTAAEVLSRGRADEQEE